MYLPVRGSFQGTNLAVGSSSLIFSHMLVIVVRKWELAFSTSLLNGSQDCSEPLWSQQGGLVGSGGICGTLGWGVLDLVPLEWFGGRAVSHQEDWGVI